MPNPEAPPSASKASARARGRRVAGTRRVPRIVVLCCTLWAAALGVLAPGIGAAEDRTLTLATTSSVENSGLLAHLLPIFESETGIDVRAVIAGTGQVLRIGRSGDTDVLLTHDRPAEIAFLTDGAGVDRRDVMHNDFVIIGRADDPAGIRGMTDAAAALDRIAAAQELFLSRGDDSGTHKAELRLWRDSGVDVGEATPGWYRETGLDQGAMLNAAAAFGAYALVDRGTWLSFRNRADLAVLVEGDPRLFNQYGVMRVNPARHAHVKAEAGRRFIDWLTSPAGQAAVAAFKVEGRQPFFPNHGTDIQ